MMNTAHITDLSDPVGLLQALIRVPSLNPPGDEAACAELLKGWLETLGFDVQVHAFGPSRINLVALPQNYTRSAPFLGFTGHMDTVPLGSAQWSYDPFGGEIHEGVIIGRGSSDMKGGIAAFISACARYVLAHKTCPHVAIILTGGEETGCDGARALAVEGRLSGLNLSGLIVGEPTANRVAIGHRGVRWLECQVTGKTAHAAMPHEGENAIERAADTVISLRALDMGASHKFLGHSTCCVSRMSAGLNINSVPDRATFTLDIRTADQDFHDTVPDRVQAQTPHGVIINSVLDIAPVAVDMSTPFVTGVRQIVSGITGEDIPPSVVPFFTDAAVLSPALGSVPTVIIGPGEPSLAHKVDEYCHIDRLEKGLRIYESCMMAL